MFLLKLNQSNRRGTDPYAWWCGRGDTARCPPIPIMQTTQSDLYNGLMARARQSGWHCCELSGGHYAMFTEPAAIGAALNDLSR